MQLLNHFCNLFRDRTHQGSSCGRGRYHNKHGVCHALGSQSPVSHHKGPGSISGQYVCDLWWTKWHWDILRVLQYPLSVTFPHCSMLVHFFIANPIQFQQLTILLNSARKTQYGHLSFSIYSPRKLNHYSLMVHLVYHSYILTSTYTLVIYH